MADPRQFEKCEEFSMLLMREKRNKKKKVVSGEKKEVNHEIHERHEKKNRNLTTDCADYTD